MRFRALFRAIGGQDDGSRRGPNSLKQELGAAVPPPLGGTQSAAPKPSGGGTSGVLDRDPQISGSPCPEPVQTQSRSYYPPKKTPRGYRTFRRAGPKSPPDSTLQIFPILAGPRAENTALCAFSVSDLLAEHGPRCAAA